MGSRTEYFGRTFNMSRDVDSGAVTNIGSLVCPRGYKATLSKLVGGFVVYEDAQNYWIQVDLWDEITPTGLINEQDSGNLIWTYAAGNQETNTATNYLIDCAHNFQYDFQSGAMSNRALEQRGYQLSNEYSPQAATIGWSVTLSASFDIDPTTCFGRFVIEYELEWIGSNQHDRLSWRDVTTFGGTDLGQVNA